MTLAVGSVLPPRLDFTNATLIADVAAQVGSSLSAPRSHGACTDLRTGQLGSCC